MERSAKIRSISRCISVLQAINRHGSLSLMDVTRAARLPYPTTCRMVQTLIHEGLIECEPTRKSYRATALVQTLSRGFKNDDEFVSKARVHAAALTTKAGWPTVIMTRVGDVMMVRDSTHHLTSLTLDLYAPGYVMPILECAAGHVYLAHALDTERDDILDGLERLASPSPLLSQFRTGKPLVQIRDDGYAAFDRDVHTHSPGKTSSISVPIFDDGLIVGTLTMLFMASTISLPEALEQNLAALRDTAAAIGADLVTPATTTPGRVHSAGRGAAKPRAA